MHARERMLASSARMAGSGRSGRRVTTTTCRQGQPKAPATAGAFAVLGSECGVPSSSSGVAKRELSVEFRLLAVSMLESRFRKEGLRAKAALLSVYCLRLDGLHPQRFPLVVPAQRTGILMTQKMVILAVAACFCPDVVEGESLGDPSFLDRTPHHSLPHGLEAVPGIPPSSRPRRCPEACAA